MRSTVRWLGGLDWVLTGSLLVFGAGTAGAQTTTVNLWPTDTDTPSDNGWDYEAQALGTPDCPSCTDGPAGCTARGRVDYPINGDLKLRAWQTSAGAVFTLEPGHRITHVRVRPTARYQDRAGTMTAQVRTTGLTSDRTLSVSTACGVQEEEDVGALTGWTQAKVRGLEVWLSRPAINDNRGHLLVDAFRVQVESECTLNPVGGISVSNPEPCEGSSVTLTAPSYDAEGPVTVVWYKVGGGQVGTGPTLVLTPLSMQDTGCYTCTLTNPCKTVSIAQACVRVVPTTRAAPLATPGPLCEGDQFALCVEASGEGLSYQWYRDGQPQGTDRCQAVATGAPSASSYFCRVTGRCGWVDTNPVTALVREATRIHGSSGAGTYCEGELVQLCVAATGSQVRYQWMLDGGAIGGATSACYSPTSAPASSGTYTCVVTGDCGVLTSAPQTVVVRARTRVTQSPPPSAPVSSGGVLHLCVTATGAGPLSYQWSKDGVPLQDGGGVSGARQACLTVDPCRYAGRGTYTCRVDGACGFAVSSACVVTVTCAAAPTITGQPVGGTFGAGRHAELCVEATGTPALRYQWYRGGAPMVDHPPGVVGSQSPCLVFDPMCILDEGFYFCRVWNDCDQQVDSRTVRARVECLADFNEDSFVDFFDYDDYVNCFEGGVCPPGKTADYNLDGFLDFFDYDLFVREFEQGCCR